MVISHLFSVRILLNCVPEKKLAILLKTLLVLEAVAKITFIVKADLIEKSTPL